MTTISIVMIILTCCGVFFGAGVSWRNQYNVQMADKLSKEYDELREEYNQLNKKMDSLNNSTDSLMELNDELVDVLKKAEDRLIELKEEKMSGVQLVWKQRKNWK